MSRITRTVDAGLATLTIDDGKANAFDREWFDELDAAFDECAEDSAVVITGRDGMFSAGLNTKVMASLDHAGLVDLLTAFGRVMLRVWTEPRPVVAAVTGHAVAGGTILAMTTDHAVAADGEFAWGLTETTIGFPMPGFVLAIARGNVPADRLDDLVLPGRLVAPGEAVDSGFADVTAAPGEVLERATTRARELAELPPGAYAATKQRLRGAAAGAALADLERDIEAALSER